MVLRILQNPAFAFLIFWIANASFFTTTVSAADRPPNIVYIMSDELAYYELSHMGNERLRTPNIDQFAKEGIRFTQALAAAPVCAPLRACMMTGKHLGHCSVRANGGGTPLRAGEPTIASMLRSRGYATGGFGKWGAGGRGSTGVPEKHGFDEFFGYYDQVHAHSFFPPYLIHNSKEVPLPGNDGGRSGATYSHYEIMERGKTFIRDNKDQPFFCYFPITPPHGMYDIPEEDPAFAAYKNDDWFNDATVSQEAKNYAAMVTMVDNDLKSVMDLIRELGLEENTIVFFTGDNGGQDRFRDKAHPRGYFGPNVNPKTGVEFRGGKGSLYEGGLRIPYLVRWPGKIKPQSVSELLCNQIDVFPTLAELTAPAPAIASNSKQDVPDDLDGLSFLTELLGEGVTGHKQEQHEALYWEFGRMTAVRMGQWKAVHSKPRARANQANQKANNNASKSAAWALYDLSNDVSESKDVSAQHPDQLAKMVAYAKQSHVPVESGTYATKEMADHQRDRRAKWGSKGAPAKQKGAPAQRGANAQKR